MLTIALLSCLFAKHFLCDFLWQTPWMIEGKGDVRRLGGYAHAGLHALLTAIVLWSFNQKGWLVLAVIEFGVHYLIDWWKVRVGRRLALTPADRGFWLILGFDQYLHAMTYVGIAMVLVPARP